MRGTYDSNHGNVCTSAASTQGTSWTTALQLSLEGRGVHLTASGAAIQAAI